MQRRQYPKSVDEEILKLFKQGIAKLQIAEQLQVPKHKVDKVVYKHGVKYTSEQRKALAKVTRAKTATQYPEGTTEKILELRKQGVKKSDIAAQLGVDINKVLSDIQKYSDHRLTKEQLSEVHREFPKEVRDQAIKMRQEGALLDDISVATGVKTGTLRFWFAHEGVRLPDEFIGSYNRKYNSETETKIVELRKQGVARKAIAEQLGVRLSKIKTHIAQEGVYLPQIDYSAKLLDLAAQEGYRVLGEYVDSGTTVLFRCPCEHVFEATPNSFFRGSRCRACYVNSITGVPKPESAKYTWQDVLSACKSARFEFLNCPSDLRAPVSALHNRRNEWQIRCHCGDLIYPNLHAVIYGSVRSCGCVKSFEQQEVNGFVRSLGFETIQNDRSLIRSPETGLPLELDIFIPALRTGIEYSGIYFHGELIKKERAETHQFEKLKACRNQNVRLVTVISDEWVFRRPQTEGRLRAILGKSDRFVDAGECSAEWVSDEEAAAFFEDNCVEGSISGRHLGLFLAGELLSLLTLVPGPEDGYAPGEVFEVACFCNRIGVSIPGAFARLIDEFVDDSPEVKLLVASSDNRWGDTATYSEAGFAIDYATTPDYWYFKNGSQGPRLHKSNFRKESIKKLHPEVDLAKTEWELMQELGYDRIWDCGTTRWVKKIG